MTRIQLEEFKLALMSISGDWTYKMCQELSIDKRTTNSNIPSWKVYFYSIYVLNRYLDIIMEYVLQVDTESSTNFYSPTDMKDIEFRINSLCVTNFSYDYILTT